MARAIAAILAVCLCAGMALGEGGDAPTLQWSDNLPETLKAAALSDKPVLIYGTLKYCEWCGLFEQTLADPTVTARLGGYLLVRVEINAINAPELNLNVAPVIVALLPNGAAAGRNEGFLPPPDFLDWLSETEKTINSGRNIKRLSPAELVPLIGGRDAILREAAAQELLDRTSKRITPEVAGVLVEAFGDGSLAVRLGTMELLKQWGAPLGEADPWKPETIPAALDALQDWAKEPDKIEIPFDFAAIEPDWQIWLTEDESQKTRAAYERLARSSEALIPKIREEMPDVWDRRRERLTALLFRLLMTDSVALAQPQAPFKMASRLAELRAEATEAVTEVVHAEGGSPEMQPFFMEVFSDPDAKVREAALRGLRETGASMARANVLRLLLDPSPNIRAGVLNDLASSPLPAVANDLADYALKETDEDLVVHATRALQGVRSKPAAFEAILKLAQHPSWRVRAEAIESLGDTVTSGFRSDRMGDSPEIAKALARALTDDDAFVVSKAIAALSDMYNADLSECAEPLMAAIEKHPDVILPALQAIMSNDSLRQKAVIPLRKLCRHESPRVRAAAIHAVVTSTELPVRDEILDGLADSESIVRTAAATGIAEWLENVEDEMEYSDGPKKPAREMIPAKTQEEFIIALRRLQNAEDIKERFAVIQSLCALGETETTYPAIEELAESSPDMTEGIIQMLPHLDWVHRRELFLLLSGRDMQGHQWAAMFETTFEKAPDEAESTLWEIFNSDPRILTQPERVLDSMLSFYGIEYGMYYAYGDDNPSALKKVSTAVQPQFESASGPRKIMLLILLCRAKKGEAPAKEFLDSDAAGGDPGLRRAAVEILFATGNPKYESHFQDALTGDDPLLRKEAVNYALNRFADTRTAPSVHVGDQSVSLGFMTSHTYYGLSGERKAWKPPALPDALSSDLLLPFLEDNDPDVALGVAYLLALQKDDSGLQRLLKGWRESQADPLMLARAIAALGDDRNSKYLNEIYAALSKDDYKGPAAQLYWIIRGMDGTEARTLRTTMRKELGSALFE